jgi:hypothetical protein
MIFLIYLFMCYVLCAGAHKSNAHNTYEKNYFSYEASRRINI